MSNRSKSGRDPADWMPRKRARCHYVCVWVAVKTRWKLTVNRAEERFLLGEARSCCSVVVRVRTANVVLR